MARGKGSANLAASLEVLAGAPLDARSRVPLKTDLTTASNFPYPYEGMKVYVIEEKKTYTLIGKDVTVLANWQEDGTGGGGQGGGHVIEDDGTPLTQRDTLNFVGFNVEDDPTTEKTVVNLPPTNFDDIENRPTVEVTPMSEIITPIPSVGIRRFKYSTDEQIVGEWINGKPIYQKTIDCGALPKNTSKAVNHNIANVQNIMSACGIAWNSEGLSLPLPFTSSQAATGCVSVVAGTTNIRLETGTDRSSYTTSYVTLQYTKTTD